MVESVMTAVPAGPARHFARAPVPASSLKVAGEVAVKAAGVPAGARQYSRPAGPVGRPGAGASWGAVGEPAP